MKVLVTGGTGYVGSYVCKMFAALHSRATIVCMTPQSVEEMKK